MNTQVAQSLPLSLSKGSRPGFERFYETADRQNCNPKKNGSSGRTRTYNPPVNSRSIFRGEAVFSAMWTESIARLGAYSSLVAVKFAVKFVEPDNTECSHSTTKVTVVIF